MNKKRLFAIVLFIVLGLFMFTFANPRNNKDDRKLNGDIITPEEQETTKEPEITTTEEETTTVITTPVVNNDQVKNNNQPKVVPTIDLSKDKQQAIDELNNHKGDYEFTNDEEYNKVIEEYTDKINNSDTKDEINKKLEDGKEAIDKLIKEDLEAYKEAAKELVKEYADKLGFKEEDIKQVLTTIYTDIDNQQTKSSVDEAKERGFDLLDSLFDEAQKQAVKDLEKYKKDYIYDDIKDEHEKIVSEGSSNINKSTTIAEIEKELKEAKDKIDKLINDYLDKYKKEKEDFIDKYTNGKDAEYTEKNQQKIDNIKIEAKENIEKATTKEKIDKIVEDTIKAIDEIQRLNDTYFTVRFVNIKGEDIVSPQKVLYKHDATQPTNVPNVVRKGVTYTFNNTWEGDYTNVKEDLIIKAQYDITEVTVKIFKLNEGVAIPEDGHGLAGSNYKYMTSSTLKLTDEIKNAAFGDKNQTIISLDDEEIRSLINKELPLYVKGKDGYVYKCYVLKLAEEAFHVDVAEVFDQELYDRNTVTVTYTINDSLNQATFANNETVYEYTEHDGSVEVKTPKVYGKDGKELNVVWTDTNNELKGEYTSSMTLTATVDRTAPEITIITDENAKPLYAGNTYNDLGATAYDNFDGKVEVLIIENTVNTNKAGTYYVTYVATDANGNSATATRTVTVNEPSTITYTISDSLNKATFADGIKTYTYTENDGTVSVNLPKVYDDGKELNVVWTDTNNELKGEYTYSTTLTATVDRTAPVITLNGDKTVNIFVNGTYTDLGATAKDNFDGEVNVTTTGEVNTRKADTYTITYTATDANGNSATETRTVVVNEVKFEGIKVESVNAKYVRYQDFNASTLKIIEMYNDQSKNQTIELNNCRTNWYGNIVCSTNNRKNVTIKGFDTGSSNVGNGRTASVEYNNLTTTYTYDVRFNTHLGQEYGKNYIEFDLPYGIPYGTYVSSITYYAADGSQTQINPYSSSENPFNYEFNTRTITYYITDTEYNLIHAMNGTSDAGNMVVTFTNGTSYKYTVVEAN